VNHAHPERQQIARSEFTHQPPSAQFFTQAARYLRTTPATLEALADQLGYSSPFHLSKAFKTEFGLSPRDYRAGGNA
jgi:AraC-like DNA-binding protein